MLNVNNQLMMLYKDAGRVSNLDHIVHRYNVVYLQDHDVYEFTQIPTDENIFFIDKNSVFHCINIFTMCVGL